MMDTNQERLERMIKNLLVQWDAWDRLVERHGESAVSLAITKSAEINAPHWDELQPMGIPTFAATNAMQLCEESTSFDDDKLMNVTIGNQTVSFSKPTTAKISDAALRSSVQALIVRIRDYIRDHGSQGSNAPYVPFFAVRDDVVVLALLTLTGDTTFPVEIFISQVNQHSEFCLTDKGEIIEPRSAAFELTERGVDNFF